MIGKNIKRLRQQKNITLSELAKQSGVSKSYLSYIERNLQKNPSIKILLRLSYALDIEMKDLLSDVQEEKSMEKPGSETITILTKADEKRVPYGKNPQA